MSNDTELPDEYPWGPGDPAYTIEDWKYEVWQGDTRLGYWDWVKKNRERDDNERRHNGG